jgi:hypothetical protein
MMKLYAPNKITWILGIVLGIVGLLGQAGYIEFFSEHTDNLLWIGWLTLAIGPLVAKKR